MNYLRHSIKLIGILAFIFLTNISVWSAENSPFVLRMLGSAKESALTPILDRFNEVMKDKGLLIQYERNVPLILKALQSGESLAGYDLLLITDALYLSQAAELGLLSAQKSTYLEQNIPSHLRDSQGHWFGLVKRARTILYNKNFVHPSEVTSYEDLGHPKFRHKLCLRDGKSSYNQSLVSFFLKTKGANATKNLLQSWMDNHPLISESDLEGVLKSLHEGRCWVGLANTYYLGYARLSFPDTPVQVAWVDQGEEKQGVHMNVVGVGVLNHATNPMAALKFIEWSLEPSQQYLYAQNSFHFPVNPQAPLTPFLLGLGQHQENTSFDLEHLFSFLLQAERMINEANWP